MHHWPMALAALVQAPSLIFTAFHSSAKLRPDRAPIPYHVRLTIRHMALACFWTAIWRILLLDDAIARTCERAMAAFNLTVARKL